MTDRDALLATIRDNPAWTDGMTILADVYGGQDPQPVPCGCLDPMYQFFPDSGCPKCGGSGIVTDHSDGLRACLWRILAEPHEDAHRMALADWHEQYGGDPERAELVRVQVELANIPHCGETSASGIAGGVRAGCPGCIAKTRESELLVAHARRWLPPCPMSEGRGFSIPGPMRATCPTCSGTGTCPATWDRGLPRVRCRLADLMEQDAYGDLKPFWRPTEWARGLAARGVVELELSDREPPPTAADCPLVLYGWLRNVRDVEATFGPATIPPPLWDLLPPRPHGGPMWKWFDTAADAHAALWRACGLWLALEAT